MWCARAPASPANCVRDIHFLQPQRHEPGGHVLSRRNDGIVFPRVIKRRRFGDPTDKLIGFAGHGRDDHNDIVAIGDFAGDALGRAADPVELATEVPPNFITRMDMRVVQFQPRPHRRGGRW